IEVVANDTDLDNANADLHVATGSILGVHGGTAVLQPDGRTVRFTPTGNANDGNTPGGFGFTYKASDRSLDSNIATVSISVAAVNDAPVAVDDAYGIDEDTMLTVPSLGVLGNDNDVDGDTLAAVLVS